MRSPGFEAPAASNGLSDPDQSFSDLPHDKCDPIIKTFKSLKCWYTNSDSLSNKFDELKTRVSITKPDIVALTEINPKFGEPNLQLSIQGYNIFCNASLPHKRGVCIFVNSNIPAFKDDVLCSSVYSESIWCRIPLSGNDCLLLGVIYHSPNCDSLNFDHLCSLLKQAVDTGVSHLLIVGDFNMPSINWTSLTVTPANAHNETFLSLLEDLYLIQHVTFPTRYRSNQLPSLLDLILSDDENTVSSVTSLPPLGKSDHIVIEFVYWCYCTIESRSVSKYLYNRGDYTSLTRELLNTDWEVLFEGLDTENMWQLFHSKLLSLIDKYIPIQSVEPNSKPMWLNSFALKTIKQKRKAWNTYKATHRQSDYVLYTTKRNIATAAVKRAKSNFELKLADSVKQNPSAFWKYVRENSKVRNEIMSLKKVDGSLTGSDQETAQCLNNFFSSVFTMEPETDLPFLPDKSKGQCLNEITIEHNDILYELNRLNPNKACGPDNCHPHVIKEVKDGLVLPLYLLFSKSLHDSYLPLCWKSALVTAIHKKGDTSLPSNYRPISLTSTFCRMLESIVKNKIVSYFQTNDFFCNEQHGFRSRRSCETQLLTVMEHWTRCIDEGASIDVVYLDFLKAFDKVPHRRLLVKLKAYGVNGRVLQWIDAFLSNRKQRVSVRGALSEWSSVTSGVPQGSVLGPTLFIIFVNDLPDCIQSYLGIFADDTKLYRPISSSGDPLILQDDINSTLQWCDTWLSFLNFPKCHHNTIGHSSSNTEYVLPSEVEDIPICTVAEEKDLGIVFDGQLKFSSHINQTITKANRVLGIIKRTFASRDANTIRLLYITLVRPILDYGSTIWNPHLMKNIRKLEAVQRRATKLISSFNNLTYFERLQKLNLPSLLYRRTRMDLIMTYKILNNLVSVDKDYFFTVNTNPTRSNGLKLFKSRFNTLTRGHSFSQRIINDWNNLPWEIVSAPNVLIFKTKLDVFLYDRRYDFI